jgi:O-antigen/teichoic acid export membrane protein
LLLRLSGGGPGAKLARGAGIAFVVSAAGTLLVFANQIVLARVLGTEMYGRYVYAVTWIGVLALIANVGFNTATVRFVAEYRATKQWGLLRGFRRRSAQIVLLASLAAAAALALAVALLRRRIGDQLALVLWAGCFLLPAWSLLELDSATLRGFKRILAAQAPPQLVRPLLIAAGILALYFLRSQPLSAALAMAVNVGATILSLLLLQMLLRRSRVEREEVPLEVRMSEWRSVALPLLALAGFGILLRSTDTLMLGLLAGTTEAGLYAVASQAALFIPFMLTAVNRMAGPMIAEYHAAGNRHRLQRILQVGAWAATVFAAGAAALVILGGKWLLALFGPEFTVSYVPMLILVGGQVLNCFAGSVGYLLIMTGYQSPATFYFGIATVANIVLNLLLIPPLGAIGASLATAASIALLNGSTLVFAVRRLGLNPTVFPITGRGGAI